MSVLLDYASEATQPANWIRAKASAAKKEMLLRREIAIRLRGSQESGKSKGLKSNGERDRTGRWIASNKSGQAGLPGVPGSGF